MNCGGLDSWCDDPAHTQGSFSAKGVFILAKLKEHDAEKLSDVLSDLYRDAVPDPMDITKFEWGGASSGTWVPTPRKSRVQAENRGECGGEKG